ncbi:helix-loop-helix DNA-binding domain-containing protein [Sordaria brevicollis]|uniref:Helix-loop-helix DNA-binding domain-containing protein n=1 Tax=Sordaria brevicollis TaxID=83679 RepID=A0AAE0UA46_SORBR|nr:helix-loop-helix DNA-binding domain-containing protein [Sordaria brevicollis]
MNQQGLPNNHPFPEPFQGIGELHPQFPDSLSGISPNTFYEELSSNTDFNTDFNSDSPGTSGSHYSPALSADSFNITIPPLGQEFTDWGVGKFEPPSELDECFKSEPFDGSIISTLPARPGSASSAINPAALSLPDATTAQDLTFSFEDINPDGPLFQFPLQNQIPFPLLVQQQQQQEQQQQQQPQQQQKIVLAEEVKTYPSRYSLKRKSSGSSSSSGEEHRQRKRASASPPPASSHGPPTKKEKDGERSRAAPMKKTAHNMIEKRYRTNLNDKITNLRDAVPSLRRAALRQENGNAQYHDAGFEDEEDDYDHHTLPKLNKATILSKATEYIGEIERKLTALHNENLQLQAKVRGMEILVMRQCGMGAHGQLGVLVG